MTKLPISAILIVQNEERNIPEVLESVAFCDEVILVDGGSTDATVEKARPYVTRLLEHPFEGFAAQKNWAIPHARYDWILLLDADERIPSSLREEIYRLYPLLSSRPQVAAYSIGREIFFMGRKVKYSGFQNDRVLRLFHKEKCRYNLKAVHETLEVEGEVATLQNKMLHYTYISIDHHVQKLTKYAELKAEDYDKKEGRITPLHIVLKPTWGFFKHYIIQLGFLDGFVGFTIAYLRSYSIMMRYIKLWLKKRNLQ